MEIKKKKVDSASKKRIFYYENVMYIILENLNNLKQHIWTFF